MSFRTIVIKNKCKLEYSLNYLVCRKQDEIKKILINEIDVLMIMSTGVALTAALVAMLIENKVKVIFCDAKSNPCGEIMPYYNNYSNYKKIKEQVKYKQETKDMIWKEIIKTKILNQRNNLFYLGLKETELLNIYIEQVEDGDITNREGHAAKVYFNSLFGKDFSRKQGNDINKYLNYGYSILLSAFNREIKICGYLTEIGIHHIGETNPFNLSCDFMEPIRPLIDSFVIKNLVDDLNFKELFINILNYKVKYDEKEMFLENAIRLYTQQLFSCLRADKTIDLKFVEYEL